MQANVAALLELAKARNWTRPELARRLGVDYSYLYRITRGEKKGGAKLWTGIYYLCKEEGLPLEEYIILGKN